jgi:hypothetical protein
VPLGTVEQILQLYQEQYRDFNVRHFHEKLREKHHIRSPASRSLKLAPTATMPSALWTHEPLAFHFPL